MGFEEFHQIPGAGHHAYKLADSEQGLDGIALDNPSAPDNVCVLVDGVGPDNAIYLDDAPFDLEHSIDDAI